MDAKKHRDARWTVRELYCNFCWKEITWRWPKAKYCSKLCKDRAAKEPRKVWLSEKLCVICWKKFTTNQSKAKYCSKECAQKQYYANVKEKTKNTIRTCAVCWKEYHPNWRLSNTCSDKCKKILAVKNQKEARLKTLWVDNPSKDESIRQKAHDTLRGKYWVHNAYDLWTGSTISKIESRFAERLKNEWHKIKQQFHIKEEVWAYDFLVDNSVIIEIDPANTHNVHDCVYLWQTIKPKEKSYHLRRTKNANLNWLRCIHIFSWDDIEKILNMISLNKKKIRADKCKLRSWIWIDNPEYTNEWLELLDWAHLQWRWNFWNSVLWYWLWYNDELIFVMTFTNKDRWSNYCKQKQPWWEILRLCTKKWYYVPYWAKRCWEHFIRDINPDYVYSFCDRAHFDWSVYLNLWMKKTAELLPELQWYLLKPNKELYKDVDWKKVPTFIRNTSLRRWFDNCVLSRFFWKKWVIPWLTKTGTNEKIMRDIGYVWVPDCWQLKFERKKV